MQETCKRATGINILEYHGNGLLTLHMPSFQPASLLTNPYDLLAANLHVWNWCMPVPEKHRLQNPVKPKELKLKGLVKVLAVLLLHI